jgi:spermidine synthase
MFDDAARYIKEEGSLQQYDVIICDSSDPVGPADVLFQPEFFLSLRNACNPQNGIICTQGECLWLHLDLIDKVTKEVKKLFPVVNYAYTTIPTYPSGQIGFIIASRDANCHPSQPTREPTNDMNLRYYTSRIHSASFILPSKFQILLFLLLCWFVLLLFVL